MYLGIYSDELDAVLNTAMEAIYQATHNRKGMALRLAIRDENDPASIYCGVTDRRSDYGDITLAWIDPDQTWRGIAKQVGSAIVAATEDMQDEHSHLTPKGYLPQEI